jgi:hypothetical protein
MSGLASVRNSCSMISRSGGRGDSSAVAHAAARIVLRWVTILENGVVRTARGAKRVPGWRLLCEGARAAYSPLRKEK